MIAKQIVSFPLSSVFSIPRSKFGSNFGGWGDQSSAAGLIVNCTHFPLYNNIVIGTSRPLWPMREILAARTWSWVLTWKWCRKFGFHREVLLKKIVAFWRVSVKIWLAQKLLVKIWVAHRSFGQNMGCTEKFLSKWKYKQLILPLRVQLPQKWVASLTKCWRNSLGGVPGQNFQEVFENSKLLHM